MVYELRKTGFDQFLNDFAQAVELAQAGEVEEARDILAASRRDMEAHAENRDDVSRGVLLYRYEVAQRILSERYGAGS